eukprot:187497_1
MSLLESDLVIPIAIGLLWSIQTCGIGYILIFYLLHECYIASRIKLFGVTTTGIITGTSHQSNLESDDQEHEHFVHYEFSINPPYPRPTWNAKQKISQSYYTQCKKGEVVRIIFDPVTRNSDFYYDGFRKNICSKSDAFCFCFIIPFPIVSIVTALYYSFNYDLISGIACIAFGLILSIPTCIWLSHRRNTFCFRFKFKESEREMGISKHQSIQDIKDTIHRNKRAHSHLEVSDIQHILNEKVEPQPPPLSVHSVNIERKTEESSAIEMEIDCKEIETPPNTVSNTSVPLARALALRDRLNSLHLKDAKSMAYTKVKVISRARTGSTPGQRMFNTYKRKRYTPSSKGSSNKTASNTMTSRSSVYLRDDEDLDAIHDEIEEHHDHQKHLQMYGDSDKTKRKSKSVSLNNNNPFVADRMRQHSWNQFTHKFAYKNQLHKYKNKESKPLYEDEEEIYKDSEQETMTLTVTGTSSGTATKSPDISPYIVDDGTASWTADTFDIYKDTSSKGSIFMANSMSNASKSISRSERKKKKKKTSQRRVSNVITPVSIKYLKPNMYQMNKNKEDEEEEKENVQMYTNKEDKVYESIHVVKTAIL